LTLIAYSCILLAYKNRITTLRFVFLLRGAYIIKGDAMPYGQIFQETVGKSISSFTTIIEIEKAAESVAGKIFPVQSIDSPIVHRHGNIFRYAAGMMSRLDERIAKLISK